MQIPTLREMHPHPIYQAEQFVVEALYQLAVLLEQFSRKLVDRAIEVVVLACKTRDTCREFVSCAGWPTDQHERRRERCIIRRAERCIIRSADDRRVLLHTFCLSALWYKSEVRLWLGYGRAEAEKTDQVRDVGRDLIADTPAPVYRLANLWSSVSLFSRSL